jgi:hypothetical protein
MGTRQFGASYENHTTMRRAGGPGANAGGAETATSGLPDQTRLAACS